MAHSRLWKSAMKDKAKGDGMVVTTSSTPEPAQPPKASSSSNPQGPPPNAVPPQPSTVPPQTEPIPELFADYEARKADIVDAIFQRHTAEGLGDPCQTCRKEGATRTTVCRECWEYPATCPSCFVNAHRRNPTHWAEVWAPERGYFVRHDISALEGNFYVNAIHLRHEGSPCPFLNRDSKQHRFTVVDTNGIHSTRLFYCRCLRRGDDVQQLLHAGLFPATVRRPEMAFTFQLFHAFHVHHLESAESAYDFIGALCHLTDGFFFDAAANPYDQFRDSFKFFRAVVTEKHSGQLLGIDEFFPHRPKGDCTVHCGACIQVGINTTDEELRIQDRRLKHLAQVSITLDGNYRASHLAKNPDLNRMAMHKGHAYFPDIPKYRVFVTKTVKPAKASVTPQKALEPLESQPGAAQKESEKTQCAYLNAVNKQDKAKFSGCDISGILNVQCSHVFVLSSVDLDLGEKFIHGDYAIMRAIQHLGLDKLDPAMLEFMDFLASYDISCAFSVKALQRCKENMPEYLPIFERFRWLIPLLHIQNHKDNCTYLYSCAYTESAGHFYGEQAEQVWPYSNQFGGQGTQMSHGNRHDLFNAIFRHWNHKKEKGLPSQLYNDLQRSDKLRGQKLQRFLGKCQLYSDKIAAWNQKDRTAGAWITMPGPDRSKEYTSVYRHNPSMLPSQKSIRESLATQVKADRIFANMEDAGKLPSMLNESIKIRKAQAQIKCNLAAYRTHETPSLLTTVASQRDQLLKSFKRLRTLQATFIPQVGEDVAAISPDLVDKTPESQPLCMPSDYGRTERESRELSAIADMEKKMLEGAAYDTIAKLRTSVRMISALADAGADVTGQDARTRREIQVQDALIQRNVLMYLYSRLLADMIRLGLPEDNPTFRPMSLNALNRRSTTATESLGKTYISEGFIHGTGGINSATQRQTYRPLINPQAPSSSSMVGTQSTQPLKRKNISKEERAKKQKLADPESLSEIALQSKAPITEAGSSGRATPSDTETASPRQSPDAGWIWGVISQTHGLTNADVEQYLSQGDSVEWFRAEAEMLRWQEEWERKLMEFVRCIRYFERLSSVWEQMATKAMKGERPAHGKAGYAKKTASRYRELAAQARTILFDQAGYKGKFELDQVLQYIKEDRAKLDKILQDALLPPPPPSVNGS